ncbi:MAG: 2-amino-4-hydroxy-6-hydroxymethyldihydropteridine diphosphokinase [Prevotella sp.]|nr:2-amino-4-hydroxy-6-hydroxymethyldihydropteridine diphosphokinase [Prevotella sp.]
MTHQVLISLAANCDQEKNLGEARRRLALVLTDVTFTRELWTDPVGASPHVSSIRYLNQLASGSTKMTVEELCQWLKQTETSMGRTAADRSKGIVRIDLDLLSYDADRYHLKDWERSYVKLLLHLSTTCDTATKQNDNPIHNEQE